MICRDREIGESKMRRKLEIESIVSYIEKLVVELPVDFEGRNSGGGALGELYMGNHPQVRQHLNFLPTSSQPGRTLEDKRQEETSIVRGGAIVL